MNDEVIAKVISKINIAKEAKTSMPKEIDINSFKFNVVSEDRPIITDYTLLDGLIDFDTMQITLNCKRAEEAIKFTLAHEIVHAIIRDYGLHKIIDKETGEKLCDALGKGIIRLIRNNKELIKYFEEVI